jgi:hypothetical protein
VSKPVVKRQPTKNLKIEVAKVNVGSQPTTNISTKVSKPVVETRPSKKHKTKSIKAKSVDTYGELAITVVTAKVLAVQRLSGELLCSASVDEETLKRLRIEFRRLRNALHLFSDVIVFSDKESLQKSLNTTLRVLGKPRDLDVLAKVTNGTPYNENIPCI